MEGIIPVEKGKHLFAKVPKNIPNEIREEIIKEQKRLKLQKRNYNYYVKNREKILKYHKNLHDKHLGVKVKCELCDREVARIRLPKHQKTALCKRYSNKKKMKDFFNLKTNN